jgi:hypothetical protein
MLQALSRQTDAEAGQWAAFFSVKIRNETGCVGAIAENRKGTKDT